MKSLRRAGVLGLGLAALAWASAQPALAQYYGGGQGYGYERRSGEGYERRSRDGYDRRDYDRRDSRRYEDRAPRFGAGEGYGRDDRRGYGRPQNPMAGMSLEEQKRAVKNEREAQKKAIKRGQFFR